MNIKSNTNKAKPFVRGAFKYDFVRSIPTNLSSDYLTDTATNWSAWEMVRESVQNMMDEAQWLSDTGAHGDDVVSKWEEKTGQYAFEFQLADFCHVWKGGNFLHLADMGRGVDFPQILLVGESGKRGQGYRGEKGEGELMSFLVAARMGIEKWMFSQNWAATGRLDYYEGTEYKVLVIDYYEAKKGKTLENRKWGTLWKYEYVPDVEIQHNSLYDMFPDLSRERIRSDEAKEKRNQDRQYKQVKSDNRARKREISKKGTNSKKLIFTPRKGTPARLYVKGIWVKDIDALFSYNLRGDVLINRDRSMVDNASLAEEIEDAFNSKDLLFSMAKRYWKESEDIAGKDKFLEYADSMYFVNDASVHIMEKAFFSVFGKKAVVATSIFDAVDAENTGFKVVLLNASAKETAVNLELPTDEGVSNSLEGEYVSLDDLSGQETRVWDLLNLIGKELLLLSMSSIDSKIVIELPADLPYLRIAEKFVSLGIERENNPAVYDVENETIIMLRDQLKSDNVLATLLYYVHELGHHGSKAKDRTRAFDEWFVRKLVALMVNPNDKLTELLALLTTEVQEVEN